MNIQNINNLRAAAGLVLLTEFPAVDILVGEEGAQDILGHDHTAETLTGESLLAPDLRHLAFFPKHTRFYTTSDIEDLTGA